VPFADLTEIAMDVLRHSDQVQVVEPRDLAEYVAGAHARAAASYRSSAHAVVG
jgi:predicted DNA-binding transcriptional regulator YafY